MNDYHEMFVDNSIFTTFPPRLMDKMNDLIIVQQTCLHLKCCRFWIMLQDAFMRKIQTIMTKVSVYILIYICRCCACPTAPRKTSTHNNRHHRHVKETHQIIEARQLK